MTVKSTDKKGKSMKTKGEDKKNIVIAAII
jgi:hypothetical protein